MKKKLVVVGILAMALVFGMAVIGCDDGGGDSGITIDGWEWVVFGDKSDGGTSTITMKQGTDDDRNKLTFAGNLTRGIPTEWDPYGYASAQAQPDGSNLTALKNADGFSFKCKGDGKSYFMIVSTSDITDYAYYRYELETTDTEQTIEISYDELEQPDYWGEPKNFNKNNIKQIEFQAHSDVTVLGQFNVTIWNLRAGDY